MLPPHVTTASRARPGPMRPPASLLLGTSRRDGCRRAWPPDRRRLRLARRWWCQRRSRGSRSGPGARRPLGLRLVRQPPTSGSPGWGWRTLLRRRSALSAWVGRARQPAGAAPRVERLDRSGAEGGRPPDGSLARQRSRGERHRAILRLWSRARRRHERSARSRLVASADGRVRRRCRPSGGPTSSAGTTRLRSP